MKFVSHSSGSWTSEIRVPAWLGFGEISFPGLQIAPFLMIHTWWRQRERELWSLPPPIWTLIPWGGHDLMSANRLPQAPSNQWGQGFTICIWRVECDHSVQNSGTHHVTCVGFGVSLGNPSACRPCCRGFSEAHGPTVCLSLDPGKAAPQPQSCWLFFLVFPD